MSYTRVAANIIIDNAHCDGMVTQLGVGRDWEALEPRDDAPGYTPDIDGQYSWWYQDVFEYVDILRAIGPIRTFTRANMAASAWALQGKWRLGSSAGQSQYRMLEFYDGRPGLYSLGQWGKATSVSSSLGPNLHFWVWRCGQAQGETDPIMFAIHLRPASGVEYALCFPGQGAAGQYHTDTTGISDAQTAEPSLWGLVPGEDKWTVIDRRKQGAAPTVGAIGEAPKLEIIRLEYDDGMLLVRTGEHDKGWAFGGKWQSYGGTEQTFALTAGIVEVRVIGHTAKFAMASLTAPTGKVLLPHKYLQMESAYNPTPVYHNIAHVPAGTTLTTVADARPGAPNHIRPAVTFGTSGGARPLLYCVQEYRTARIDSADSVPLDTYQADSFTLMECSGQVGESWRGSSITATLQNRLTTPVGTDLNFAKPNSKVRVNVQTTGVPITLFTGYAAAPEQAMLPGSRVGYTSNAKTEAKLAAHDIIEARLSKKQMLFHCSYEGWTEGAAFAHILNRAGVPGPADVTADPTGCPNALVYVDPACTNILPSASRRGTRRFKFSPDCEVIAALDTIAKAYGRRWGVNAAGVVFLVPAYAHSSGHYLWHWHDDEPHWRWEWVSGSYNFTLDYDSIVSEDLVDAFQSTMTISDFRNFLLVMVGEGNDAAAKIITDQASMMTDTAVNFVGDIWSKFVAFPDGSDLDTIAVALWDEIATWQHYVEWGMKDCPWIMPDHEVRMQVPTNLVANNAVFRVLSKSWACQRDGRFSQTLQSKYVGMAT